MPCGLPCLSKQAHSKGLALMPCGLSCLIIVGARPTTMRWAFSGLTIMDGIASGLSPAAACAIRICAPGIACQPMLVR